MRIDIITLFPDLLKSPFEVSILKRAIASGIAEVNLHDLRTYSKYKQRKVDDYPFGGGAGMVMMVEPIDRCIETLKKIKKYDAIIYLTPDGKKLDQKQANHFSTLENIIILCGHYKGVDQRVRDHLITHELSIGDFFYLEGN
jgi:tRNA (guanine37-N1)-methyltransferase